MNEAYPLAGWGEHWTNYPLWETEPGLELLSEYDLNVAIAKWSTIRDQKFRPTEERNKYRFWVRKAEAELLAKKLVKE